MPVLPLPAVNAGIYLYPDRSAAEARKREGGSGCLVLVQFAEESDGSPIGSVYAVTAGHVVKGGCTALRLNPNDGGQATILDLDESSWFFHPDEMVDLAIAPISVPRALAGHPIPPSHFVRPDEADKYAIGQEVFMTGRFVNHEGRERNVPIVRYGNIAQLAPEPEPIRTSDGDRIAFLVDMRSLSGYSGSPVFVYRSRPDLNSPEKADSWIGSLEIRFLGIDMAHIADYRPLLEHDEKGKKRIFTPEKWTEQNSGMACVVPAWYLNDLLFENEEIVEMRKNAEEKWQEEHPPGVVFDAAPEADGPRHDRAEFYADLDRAIEPDDKPPKEGS